MIETFKAKASFPLFVAAFFCLALYGLGIYCRPLLPVDETRYLTVAWEMFSSGDWILPRLNTEAYDHKPPLLFWSINILWAIFGVSKEAAMAVPFIFAFAFIFFTHRLAGKLLPQDKSFPAVVTYVLIGCLPFIIYSNMIMFDLVLGVFAVMGITAIWDYKHTGQRKHIFFFTLAIGLGAVTKGPVILLHTLFPILLVKFWAEKNSISRRKWASGFSLAILGGVILGLCWAIPAAIKGGPDFANKIFWGQTAGRVTNAFDHKEPILWYVEFLPLILAPWIFSPLLWRGLKTIRMSPYKPVFRFLAAWAIPPFICFCLISGKQIHYLLPLIPAFAIFTGLIFKQMENAFRPRDALFPFIFTGTLILLPFFLKLIAPEFSRVLESPLLIGILDKVSLSVPLALFTLSGLLVFALSKKNMLSHTLAIALSSLMLMACFQLESKNGLFKNYDLTPIAEIVMKNPEAPLAFARNYHGEWGFMARLHRPVKQLEPETLPEFFKAHPNGMAFMRTGHPEELLPYDVIFSMPYKMDNTYNIIVKRGQARHFSK